MQKWIEQQINVSLCLCLKVNKLKKEKERKNVDASIASRERIVCKFFPLKGGGEEAQWCGKPRTDQDGVLGSSHHG